MFTMMMAPGGCTQRQDPRQALGYSIALPPAACSVWTVLSQDLCQVAENRLHPGRDPTQCDLRLSSAVLAQKRASVLFSAARSPAVSTNAVVNIQSSRVQMRDTGRQPPRCSVCQVPIENRFHVFENTK